MESRDRSLAVTVVNESTS